MVVQQILDLSVLVRIQVGQQVDPQRMLRVLFIRWRGECIAMGSLDKWYQQAAKVILPKRQE